MAFKLFEAYGEIVLKGADKVESGLKNVTTGAGNTGKSLTNLSSIGKVALAGLGAVAVKSAVSFTTNMVKAADNFQKSMSGVATLLEGNVGPKIEKMSSQVQNLAIQTGKSTETLSSGLYEVISAFGETAESVGQLETATKSAVAGGAEVKDSVQLLSAVTKGYGDTSIEAMEKVSDLAFQTVKLGQTTFPELASSMQRVIPLSSTLKVSQEELFGAMATLTGVTGNTAEVSTQLKNVFQAFLKPTADMKNALGTIAIEMAKNGELTGENQTKILSLNDVMESSANRMTELGMAGKQNSDEYKALSKTYKSAETALGDLTAGMGQNIVESKGLGGTLQALKTATGGSDAEMSKLFGSIEAVNSVLALTGSQAEIFTNKTAQMSSASGATADAFDKQRNTFERLGSAFQVFQERIGNELLPIVDTLVNFLANNAPNAIGKVVLEVRSAIERIQKFAQLISDTVNIVKTFADSVVTSFQYFRSQSELIWTSVKLTVLEAIQGMINSIGGIVSKIPGLGNVFGNLSDTIGVSVDSAKADYNRLKNETASLEQQVSQNNQNVRNSVTQTATHWKENNNKIRETISQLSNHHSSESQKQSNTEQIKQTNMNASAQTGAQKRQQINQNENSTILNNTKNTANQVIQTKTQEQNSIVSITKKANNSIIANQKTFSSTFTNIATQVGTSVSRTFTSATGNWKTSFNSFKSYFSSFSSSLKNISSSMVSSIKNAFESMTSTISSVTSNVKSKINSLSSSVSSKISSITSKLSSIVGGAKETLGLATGGIVQKPVYAMIGEGNYKEAVLPLNNDTFGSLAQGIVNNLPQTGRGKNVNITVTGNNISSDYDIDKIGDKLINKLRREGVI